MIHSSDVHAQEYSEKVSKGDVHIRSPVEGYVNQKFRLRELIAEYYARIIPVAKLTDDLKKGHVVNDFDDAVMLALLRRHFWKGENISALSVHMHMSRSALSEHKRILIMKAREYIEGNE